jgi:hypothetical protein
MAIIAGKQPKAAATEIPRRIIIKLAPEHSAGAQPAELRRFAADRLKQVVPKARFEVLGENEPLSAKAQAVLGPYVAISLPKGAKADKIVRQLTAQNEVEIAYLEGGPTPPPVNPADDPRSANQGYLDAAPGGIDARWTWNTADGTGVGFVDMEQGWTLNHEDLAGAGITIISGLNQAYPGHGTAVLGEITSVDNQIGGVGIAPRCSARVVSQWRTATSYDTAAAILSATDVMSPGDILLLEAQTSQNGLSYLPVEVEAAVFDAINHATGQGIVVVEAAGNGSHDLDTFTDNAGNYVLNRSSGNYKDSGAIMVGAASSAAPHARLNFSNFGSRIDCFGWGENIDTTGDGWQGSSTTAYTTSFGGTSGASPIVAGAALLLQSWSRKVRSGTYDPSSIRDLLSNPEANTPSAMPTTDRIGVMPNLRAIIEAQIAVDTWHGIGDRYVSFVQILLGIINDSPGWIWVPGKGPVPVDPGWGSRVERISADKRDLLAALAANEIAERVTDAGVKRLLLEASAAAMKKAVQKIAEGN